MTAALTFGVWLKRRRQSLGLTQKELARQVGYAPVTLRKVEADELRPSGEMARKLAEALEIAPEEQIQFVRFARDEAYWDDLALPERAPSPPLPTMQQPAQEPPAQEQPVPQRRDVTLDRRRVRDSLPALTTALVGREEELAELAQLLADPGTRLVTILSAGGMGKTSLATAAARQQVDQFEDGVCWVPLAPLTEAGESCQRISPVRWPKVCYLFCVALPESLDGGAARKRGATMTWYLLAALALPPLIIYAYLHMGRPRRPGYTGNGDIYGALPDAATRAAEDIEPGHVDSIRSNLDLVTNAQLQGMRAASRDASRRESDGF